MASKASPFIERNPALKQAEDAADKALRWCLRKLRLKTAPLPIPIDVWIERPMGLELVIMDMKKAYKSEEIEGNTVPADYAIEIEQTLVDDDPRFRFVCAHEVGHMLLHRDAKRVFVDRTHVPLTLHSIQEAQADRFAISFLMPLQTLFDRLFWLAEQHRTEPLKFMEILMANSPDAELLWARVVLPDLQRAFGLSVEHLINRLASLRLRKGSQEFLQYPVAQRLRQHCSRIPQPPTRKCDATRSNGEQEGQRR